MAACLIVISVSCNCLFLEIKYAPAADDDDDDCWQAVMHPYLYRCPLITVVERKPA